MSLRNSLRSATELRVASANTRNTQLIKGSSATGTATSAQQPADNPHECSLFAATGTATGAQQPNIQGRNSIENPQELRVAFAKARNSQLGGLTAHRLLPDLIVSINRCCDARGDDARNRASLIVESAAFAPHEMHDSIEHFDQETAIWLRACGRPAP